MLFAKYFAAYIYDPGKGAFSGGSYTDGGYKYIPEMTPKYGTGRGGIISNGVVADGDDGRPGASDDSTGPVEPSLAGGKGTLTAPGDGLNAGLFGFGGDASKTNTGWTSSAGGGSGWFGGGSAFLDGGGGGGSNFCYSNNDYCEQGIKAAGFDNYGNPVFSPPDWLNRGLWVGVNPSTTTHYYENIALYDINTRHITEYDKYKVSLGLAYDRFIELRSLAAGNGLVLISKPNTMIRINKNTGTIDNIGTIVQYSGSDFEWTPDTSYDLASYHFILWGAQGGTIMYTPAGMQGLTYQQYTGGFGGAIGGVFDIPTFHTTLDKDGNEVQELTKLYINVGQAGNTSRLQRAWNGGGNGDGGSTSGGGATDIRWTPNGGSWQGNLSKRFIVAGGGGGCIGSGGAGGDNTPKPPFKEPQITPEEDDDKEEGVIVIPGEDKPPYFLVNDLSLVYVTIKYFTQSELPSVYDLSCTLYVDGGNEGVLYQDFRINTVSGVIELVYPLDQIYPENTETHWVTLIAKIKTSIMLVIPDKGINIRVETRARQNESNNNLDITKQPIFVRLLEKLRITDRYNVSFSELGKDITTEITDKFNIIDKYAIQLKAVELLKISILENLSFKDFNNISTEQAPVIGNILLSKLEGINLIDKVNIIINEIEHQSRGDVEHLGINDLSNITFKSVELLKLKVVESLVLSDINNIEEVDNNE